jgi:hypothetical protein
MICISATRLRVRSPLFLPLFLWHTYRSKRQIERAAGFLGGKLLVDQALGAWTITLWDDPKRLVRYRNQGSHGTAMKILGMIADEAVSVRWQVEQPVLPDWEMVRDRLMQEGNFIDLPHASAHHQQRSLPLPKLSQWVRDVPVMPRT